MMMMTEEGSYRLYDERQRERYTAQSAYMSVDIFIIVKPSEFREHVT